MDDIKISNRKALSTCLNIADISYSNYWDSNCKTIGLKAGCSLPSDTADGVEKSKKTDQDNCFKRYPQ
ncbi:MAG: hypothetical protein WC823_04750 [Parcubacteria group bacterium]|jgi:hypothetical protein